MIMTNKKHGKVVCMYLPQMKKAFGGLAMSRGTDRCSLKCGLPKVNIPLWKDHLERVAKDGVTESDLISSATALI